MVHVVPQYTNLLQDTISSFGYICVTLFFMFSAYGMQLSVEYKKNYLNNFWRNRLVSLLIPCFLINICAYVLVSLLKNSLSSTYLLYKINNYVLVLLQYCLWFYFVMQCKRIFKINKTWIIDGVLIAGVMGSSLILYFTSSEGVVSARIGWCYERYGLIWGLLLYRFLSSFRFWLTEKRTLKIIVFFLLSLILGVAYLKFKTVYFYGEYFLKIVLGAVIIIFMLLATVGRQYGNKLSFFLGNISYEVYLSHGIIMGILATVLPEVSSGLFIVLSYCCILLFSALIHSVSSKLVNYWRI